MTSNKLLKLTAIGLLSLFLLGCSTQSVIKEYVYVHDAVSTPLLAACPGYDGPLVDNGDLAQAYVTERQGRLACNADKEALREWEAQRKAEPKPSGK